MAIATTMRPEWSVTFTGRAGPSVSAMSAPRKDVVDACRENPSTGLPGHRSSTPTHTCEVSTMPRSSKAVLPESLPPPEGSSPRTTLLGSPLAASPAWPRAVLRRSRRLIAGPVGAAMLMVGLAAVTPVFSSASGARRVSPSPTINCAAPATGPERAGDGAATSTPYGRVLVIGSGDQAGCSLYLLSSDRLHTLNPTAPFACSDNPNPTGAACDTVLWPALLTDVARPLPGGGPTPPCWGRLPAPISPSAARSSRSPTPGCPSTGSLWMKAQATLEGANLFDPVTTPTGIWYLVNPGNGLPCPRKPSRCDWKPPRWAAPALTRRCWR